MCAFIDDLVDAFGDDVDLGAAKIVHPYLPKTSSEVADEATHDKLTVELATNASEDDVATSPVEMVESPRERSYSPTRRHHRYLPMPKAPEQPSENSKQEKAEVVSDVAISVEADKDAPTAIEEKAKPFRRINSMHLYLHDAGTSEQGSLDSSSLTDDKQNKNHESCDKKGSDESALMKLDIDAMLAALPPRVPEVETVTTCCSPMYATPEMVLEANPDLHGRMSAFLCESRGFRDFRAADMRVRVR
jgi:hypothetical protein